MVTWESRNDALKETMADYEASLPAKILNWEKFFNESDTETAPEAIRPVLAKLPSQRSKEEQALLSKQFKANDKDYQSLTKEQELQADAGAVRLTGKKGPAVSALTKLVGGNIVPVRTGKAASDSRVELFREHRKVR